MKNKFIVFEGIDGVGKTSLVLALQKELRRRGISAVRYEDYERSDVGFNILKPFIKKNTPIDSSLFFYLASAINKSAMIEKLLKRSWVIADRYVYSTFAYHVVRGADKKLVAPMRALPIVVPDFCFLVTADETIRLERARQREGATEDDLKPKRKGGLVWKMEEELKKFRLTMVDNSSPDIFVALKKIFEEVSR